ncbi:MAG: helix-turn-helix transcriptional regulator [Desulfobacteraceae bacterium]|nr:helix-turn-helix transcriptional regulator [Desulfobacteraceae bacterium]
MYSKRLKLVRKESNSLTQHQLSELLEIPLHKIKSIESDKTKISIEIALKIEEKLNFSFKWILTGVGEKFISKVDPESSIIKDNNLNLKKVIVEHQDVIKKFKDSKKAKEFNEFLIEIEDGDPEGYEGLYKEAKTISKTINRLKEKDSIKKKQQTSFTKRQVNGD